jgi:4-diphosphocytidyl-2-C-methyl-D-erythritol kinase
MFVKQLSDRQVRIGAPAKINLFLQVLNKRPDGYHNINSLFQAVSLFDRLTVTRTSEPGARIKLLEGTDLSTGPDNLIARAYDLLAKKFDLRGGINVELDKQIPVAAGLAGGSSDAAATLTACNILFSLGLDRAALAESGTQLGSDVPFFFGKGQALVSGRGEILQETSYPTDYWLILVNPGFPASTPEGYARLKRGLTRSSTIFTLGPCPTVEDFIDSLSLSGNDFEENLRRSFPVLSRIDEEIVRSGAALVRMSGSGPTFFGIYTEMPDSEKLLSDRLDALRVYTVRPIVVPEQQQ